MNEIWGDSEEEYEKPLIDTVTFSPAYPEPGEDIAVYAKIESSSPLQKVEMFWGTSTQNYPNQQELNPLGGYYTDSIQGQTDTDSLYVIVEARNSSDSIARSKEYVLGYDKNTMVADFDPSAKSTKPNIFPNPTKNILFVNFNQPVGVSTLELYNLNGTLIQKKEISKAGKQKVSFRITNVSRGTYILKTTTKENVHYNKVLIK